jgi:hypothetical protein
MLERFSSGSARQATAKNPGRTSSGGGNKRKGNRKDDYEGLSPEEQKRLKQKREKNKEAAARY